MAFTERQELRQKLLLEAINSLSDPKAALALARDMELFVIEGVAGTLGAGRREANPGTTAEPSKKPRWTKSDELHLRELWVGGRSIKEIARELGRSEASVGARARQLSLPSRSERLRSRPEPTKETNVEFSCVDSPVRIEHHSPNGQRRINVSDGSGPDEDPQHGS